MVAETQAKLTSEGGKVKWTPELERRFTIEFGALGDVGESYEQVYCRVIKQAINMGHRFNLNEFDSSEIENLVRRLKAISAYNGWLKFYGDPSLENSVPGILFNESDPAKQKPSLAQSNARLNSAIRNEDLISQVFRYKRGFDSLRDDPADTTSWGPNRESWSDEYPLFYHSPDLNVPSDKVAVAWFGLDMDLLTPNMKKSEIGSIKDPLMK